MLLGNDGTILMAINAALEPNSRVDSGFAFN
jgi:hypothetical protein